MFPCRGILRQQLDDNDLQHGCDRPGDLGHLHGFTTERRQQLHRDDLRRSPRPEDSVRHHHHDDDDRAQRQHCGHGARGLGLPNVDARIRSLHPLEA